MRHRSVCLMSPILAAALLAPSAVPAQTAPALRGSQGPADLAVKPAIGLDPPPLRLSKPSSVTRIGAQAPVPPPRPPALEPAPAAPRLRPASDQPDPYDPLGLRWGAFLLRPTIEVDFGHDSNPGRQPGPVASAPFLGVSSKLDIASDWSRHELHGSIDGDLVHYLGIEDANRPRLDALLGGRLDVDRDTALEGEARLNLDTERIGSDGVPTTATKRPLTETYGGTIGFLRRFGDAAVSLRGSADQNAYEEVTPGDNRDYATYGVALRGTYEVTPGIRPFAELSGDARRYDEAPLSGPERDSRGLAGRAGAALDLTGKLAGEVSIGYGRRLYDDPALEPIGGVLADASLIWTASALTKVTLRAGTSFDETTEAGSSGYVSRTVGLEIEHKLRRNLVVSLAGKVTRDSYDGISRTDDTYDARLGIEYRLTRSVAVKAEYGYEHLASTVPGTDYTANVVMVGLKLQP